MAKDQKESAPAAPPSFWSVLMPVLSFVGTGIGLIGFVVFFGGFVLWTRFDEIGLPADEAVWHVPKDDLVTTGASFLVPTVALGAVAVAIAFAARAWTIGRSQRQRVAEAAHKVSSAELALEKAENHARAAERDFVAEQSAAERSIQAYDTLAQTARTPEEREAAAHGSRAVVAERTRRQRAADDAAEAVVRAKAQLEMGRRALAGASDLTPTENFWQWVAGAVAILAACMIYVAFTQDGLPLLTLLVVVAMAAAVVGLALTVLDVTGSYGWFALSAFVGVGLVVATTTYMRTRDEVKVSPVAVVAGGVPHVGYLVAESPDAVYLAQPVPEDAKGLVFDHGRTRLVRLDKKQVTDLLVGPLAAQDTAYVRALEAAQQLCQRVKAATPAAASGASVKPAAAASAAPETVCSTADQKDLTQRLETASRLTAPSALRRRPA